jgi:hypothetical protein
MLTVNVNCVTMLHVVALHLIELKPSTLAMPITLPWTIAIQQIDIRGLGAAPFCKYLQKFERESDN